MILSLQSDVLHGTVGHKAALPIYHHAGLAVTSINTIQLAAHPGFGTTARAILSADQLSALLDDYLKLPDRPALHAIHIGYFGDASQIMPICDFITTLKQDKRFQKDKDCVILVDPVFGDAGRQYVSDKIVSTVIETLLPLADIITPNQFECGLITADNAIAFDDKVALQAAFAHLPARYKALTGIMSDDGQIVTDYLMAGDRVYHSAKPARTQGVSGGGDAFAALFLSAFLTGKTPEEALTHANHITGIMMAQSTSPLTLSIASGLDEIIAK